MHNRFDAIVFDIGGVLIDWNPRRMYRKIFDDERDMEDFLANVCTPEWNHELDRGLPFAEGVALLVSRHPGFEAEISAYDSRWEEMLGGSIEASVEILEELHARGKRLFALTNFSAEKFPVARSRHVFLDLFDDIVVSGEEGLVKPDKEIYELLIERAGMNPARAIFVDDREENVRAAEEAGFVGVVFEEPRQLRRELEKLGVFSEARP